MKERFFYGFRIEETHNWSYEQNIPVFNIVDFIKVSKKLKKHMIPFRIEVRYWDDFFNETETISYKGPEDILEVVMDFTEFSFYDIIIIPLTFGVDRWDKAQTREHSYIERMVDSSFLRENFLGLREKIQLKDYLKYKKGDLRRERKSRVRT